MTREEFERLYTRLKKSKIKGNDAPTYEELKQLEPFKVETAVIMAAGMSSRFVPLSLEKPKGLLIVKGEVLIERQIRQLIDAGIKDIIIVLGYMLEDFRYLAKKFPYIKLVENPEYDIKNNTHTLYVAQEHIGNSYICSSDDYFTENPFEEYVYQSYYAAVHVDERTDEWYMLSDDNRNITAVSWNETSGDIMLGHSYWNKEFSKSIIRIINDDADIGRYDQMLWEQILADNVDKLPPMEIKVYPSGVITEFDSLDELRKFDLEYIDNTGSKIMQRISRELGCREGEISGFRIEEKLADRIVLSFIAEGKEHKYLHMISQEDKWEIV